MKTLSCQDVSGVACPFVAKGETEEEAIQQLMDHAKTAHPEESAKMMEGKSEEEMNEMLKSKVKEEMAEDMGGGDAGEAAGGDTGAAM
jgi:predicted small metal-binding protein